MLDTRLREGHEMRKAGSDPGLMSGLVATEYCLPIGSYGQGAEQTCGNREFDHD